MTSKIDQLFDSLREPHIETPEKYHLGEVPIFAAQTPYRESTLIIIISLYCAVCIELLTRLEEIAEVFDGQLVLVVDGNEDEAQVIQQHFEFSFNVLSASAEEFHYVYRPEFTPFAYVLNTDRTIAYMGDVEEVMTTKGTIVQLDLMPTIEEGFRS